MTSVYFCTLATIAMPSLLCHVPDASYFSGSRTFLTISCLTLAFFFMFITYFFPFSMLSQLLEFYLVSVQWKRMPTSNGPPPARAYHSMTCIGSRYLLFGGYDGKTTYGDLWWLVPEGNFNLFLMFF